MKIDLSGRSALITGGSRGLGFACARNFVESGANVAILSRNPKHLDEARRQLLECAPCAHVVALGCDVKSRADLEKAFAAASKELGAIDILVNNAGGHASGRFETLTDEDFTNDLELKLMASVRLIRLAWPGMAQRRWGRVINVLNNLAKAPPAGTAPTSVTRAAQIALTKVLSHEGAPHNILVNALLVGVIMSDQLPSMHQRAGAGQSLDSFVAGFAQRIPLGRVGEADEFGKVACFLASDAASYITGTAINVDGGMSPVT